MLFSRTLLKLLTAAIASIILLFQLTALCYGSNKALTAGVDENGTIVILGKNEVASCPAGLCEIFPEDGKIEGKQVSLMNPAGINNSGQVVGTAVLQEDSEKYPFVREPDGRLWIFKTPSESGQGEFTDISNTGKAVGFYEKSRTSANIGFVMNSRGQWEMDISYPSNPCPAARSYLHTQPNGINDEDEIVGNYDCTERPDDSADPIFKGNGFYRAPDGTFYRVQFENARRTVAGKINNAGVIFGYYVVDDETWVPFAAEKKEVLRPLIP